MFLLYLVAAAALANGDTPPASNNSGACPAAAHLPQLTIGMVADPAVPVIDDWQILWGDVPVSDAQLAALVGDEMAIEATRREMQQRGAWVFVGLGTAALGTAVSSVGWVLYGENSLPRGVTLSLGIGGLLAGLAGVLFTTEAIQRPLEPHLAPTPRHRFSRADAQELVVAINQRIYRDVCSVVLSPAGSEP